MGADIHVHVERNTKNGWEEIALYDKNGDWVEVGGDRCYPLFERLAGVRGFQPDGFPSVRGIPEDVSREVGASWEEDQEWCHSASYLDWVELILLSKLPSAMEYNEVWDEETHTYKAVDGWNPVEKWIGQLYVILDGYGIYFPNPNDVRIVFWFDN